MKRFPLSLLSCLLATSSVASFATHPCSVARGSVVLAAATTDAASQGATAAAVADDGDVRRLKGDRYVASNRFAVRAGKEAKFEKRWARRKSRLAELDGFRYFHLMRRVALDGADAAYDGGDKKTAFGNYVSLTVWENKRNFNAWRKGDAFREAHGGTSIGAFLSTMVSSVRVLRGAPKPAFYDGLLVQGGAPEFLPPTVDGWRDVEVPEDGGTLPAECFVACNQFFVPPDSAVAFEQRWKGRESKLRECEGFVCFAMLRRDARQKGHGTVEMDEATEPTYVSTTIWKDRASFDKWRSGANFSKSHGEGRGGGDGASGGKPARAQGPPQWSRPPEPIFYEGTLVISTADGV